MKIVVYWKNLKNKKEYCQKLGLHTLMNVNKESEYNVEDEVLKEIERLEKEGVIQIRKK